MMTQGITQPMTHQAYELDHDISHLVGDLEYDAWLVEFPGWEEIDTGFWEPQIITLNGDEGVLIREKSADGLWHATQFSLPERIEFDCDGTRLQVSDYPYIKQGWPIMSKRMLNVLLSVREFSYQAIPVVMKDIFVPPKFEENHDFVVVQLLENQDIFDWEKSIYERDPDRPNRIKSISLEKLVLREPSQGFPPLFRLSNVIRSQLFISAESRSALEAAGIRGVKFVELRGS
jgi:hypothetical protein